MFVFCFHFKRCQRTSSWHPPHSTAEFSSAQVTFFYSNAEDTHFGKIASTITDVFSKSGIEITAKRTWDTHYLHGYTINPFVKLIADTYQDTRSEFKQSNVFFPFLIFRTCQWALDSRLGIVEGSRRRSPPFTALAARRKKPFKMFCVRIIKLFTERALRSSYTFCVIYVFILE